MKMVTMQLYCGSRVPIQMGLLKLTIPYRMSAKKVYIIVLSYKHRNVSPSIT